MTRNAATDTETAPVSFRTRMRNSAVLSTIQFLSQIALRLVSTIVLTRLLAPEIYGVFAIVLVYRYLLEMLSDLGLRAVILTREGDLTDRFLQTCWTVSILRGGAIALGSAAVGVVIFALQRSGVFPPDSAYVSPALPLAIAALGCVSFLNGFQSMNRFAYERGMSFRRITIGNIASNMIGLVVTIALAVYLRSIWALVFGAFVPAVFLVVFSFLAFSGPKMRLAWETASAEVIWDRGKWIIGHSVLTAATRAADRLLLGLVMSSATFGFYFIARQITEILVGFFQTVNSQMGLQVFTHILKAPSDTVRRNYYRYRFFFDALAGLSAGGLVILAPLLVELVFDDRYSGVAPIVRILALAFPLSGPLLLRFAFSAERKFRDMTAVSLLSAVVLWAGLLASIFVLDSVTAALVVIALHQLPEAVVLWWLGRKQGWVTAWRELLPLVFFGVGLVLGLAALALWESLA